MPGQGLLCRALHAAAPGMQRAGVPGRPEGPSAPEALWLEDSQLQAKRVLPADTGEPFLSGEALG